MSRKCFITSLNTAEPSSPASLFTSSRTSFLRRKLARCLVTRRSIFSVCGDRGFQISVRSVRLERCAGIQSGENADSVFIVVSLSWQGSRSSLCLLGTRMREDPRPKAARRHCCRGPKPTAGVGERTQSRRSDGPAAFASRLHPLFVPTQPYQSN